MINKVLFIIFISIIKINTFQIEASDGVDKDEYCYQILGDGCQNCFMSFLNDDVCQPPSNKIENCLKYRDSQKCNMCQLGLQLIDNECVKIEKPTNCIQKDILGNCSLCKNKLYIDKNFECNQKCTIENCDICQYDYLNNKEYCYLCKDGFVANKKIDGEKISYSCIEDKEIPNCWISKPNYSNRCSKCKLNFYQNQKQDCIKSSKYETSLMDFEKKLLLNLLIIFVF